MCLPSDPMRKKQKVMRTRRAGVASPMRDACSCSKIDAKRGVRFLQPDSLPILLLYLPKKCFSLQPLKPWRPTMPLSEPRS